MDEKRARIAGLAAAVNFDAPVCGHVGTRFTATRVVDGQPRLVCHSCFDATRDVDRAARLARTPLRGDLTCGLCDASPARENVDLGVSICDGCRTQNERLMSQAEHVLLAQPRAPVVPDEVSPGMLFIGPKECAFSSLPFAAHNITQVLVCCDSLPAPLHTEPSASHILFHRLPMQDSLVENLASFLPSALSFIARGVLRGEATLVHCNAGVSRSGSIAVEWLRRVELLDLDSALVAARRGRPIITPNSNFMTQLRALP
eukprot:m.46649 g.46649  ORF g.46649 m.46649 type:complete len:259 (-) comp11160_c0_seq1:23-799(-)